MTRIDDDELTSTVLRLRRFVDEHSREWSLRYDSSLEATNHVLRVLVQDGTVAGYRDELGLLCAHQHADGGWGDRRDDAVSRTRTTAFATQMLLRANRVLHNPELKESVDRGVCFLLARQRPDGGWEDDRWHHLDATSVSVGTLLFASRDPDPDARVVPALRRGMSYVLGRRRNDGMWYHRPRSSPVEITAHFLQKVVPYGGSPDTVVPAMEGLLARQHPEGHWDAENVDSTCDAVRALFLSAQAVGNEGLVARVLQAGELTARWLVNAVTDGGLGPRPKRKPRVLFTCDGIDALFKLQKFRGPADSLHALYS
jgi:hypothetical protein